MEKAYIVFVIDIYEKTQQDHYNEWLDSDKYSSAIDFWEQQKRWGEYTYQGVFEEMGFFTDCSEATQAVVNNMADINECGSWNYAAIVPINLNCMYPWGETDRSEISLFQYNNEAYHFDKIKNNTQLARYIMHKVTGVFEPDDSEI